MDEIDAISFLLDLDYGFDQYDLLRAYKSSVLNVVDDVEKPYLVNWGQEPNIEEKSFQTAREASEFFVQKRKEMNL